MAGIIRRFACTRNGTLRATAHQREQGAPA